MSQYIVSARKYRPDSFGTLIGQDNIAQTLKNSILRGQLAHAYLFCGPRGVGKTTTARIFAKMINCSNPSADMEPCGTCESCLSFAEGRSYCIHELDAASNNGVEDIKTLMDQVRIPPQVGKYSVYIIDEVHMLSQSAFNAFLKTLEEPPAHAIFILATTEKHKILPTILSRCQTYDFNRITIENIVRNLRMVASSENITIDDESLHVIAHKADGAMRDALTIFDQTVAFCGTDVKYQDVLRNLNVLDYEYSFSLVDAFLKGDYPTALLTFDEILTKGFNALHFVAALSSHLRDLIVSKSGGLEALLELPDSLKSKYKEQSDRCSLPFLYEALNITTACESGYRASVNPRLHIEFALMRLSFVLTKMPAPAQQQVPTQAPAATPAVQSPAPAPSPEQPAPAPSPAPAQAQPQRRERVARTNTAAASVKSLIGNEPEIRTEVDTGSAPSEETLRAKWPELAKEYASKPRMASMLSTTTLKITGDDTQRTVTFMVDNDAQKDWVESKLLHDLEGRYQKIVGSGRVVLRVDVIPHEEVKPVAYMPEDKIKELMAQNEEVKSFVKDLGLDIK
jgi:DNA polymerase-3 subunit gamma/tau